MSDEQIQLQPAAIPLAEFFARWCVLLAPLFLIAGMMWGFHLLWHRFDPVIFFLLWVPAGCTKIYLGYLRAFNPQRVPPMLAEDSQELGKLKRKKTLLNQVGYGALGFCVLVGSSISLFTGWHQGQGCFFLPDALWPWFALPIVVGCICIFWAQVIEALMKERTVPVVKGVTAGRAPRSGRVISGEAFQGNGFQSDHWGEAGSETQMQVESDM